MQDGIEKSISLEMDREKETVPVPTKKEVEDAARLTAEEHPSGGRVWEQQKEKRENE